MRFLGTMLCSITANSRLDAITFPKWRTESVKGGGNAIVPQVAFQIFKAISLHESSLSEAQLPDTRKI
jgi:hypothetical protein